MVTNPHGSETRVLIEADDATGAFGPGDSSDSGSDMQSPVPIASIELGILPPGFVDPSTEETVINWTGPWQATL